MANPDIANDLLLGSTKHSEEKSALKALLTSKVGNAQDKRHDVIAAAADQLCTLSIEQSKDLCARPVTSYEEIESAFRLIYKEYSARRYCQSNEEGLHYSIFSLLPESRTFIIEQNGAVAGTVSLIIDSPLGLPMEKEFPEAIASLRKPNRKIAEVGLLAMDSQLFPRNRFSLLDAQKMGHLFALCKTIFDSSQHASITDLIISVHPKHELLYSYLCFDRIGEVKTYNSACGNLAQPMRRDNLHVVETKYRNNLARAKYFLENCQTKEFYDTRFRWNTEAVSMLLSLTPSLVAKLSASNIQRLQRAFGLSIIPGR